VQAVRRGCRADPGRAPNGKPTPAGLFQGGGTTVFKLQGDPSKAAQVAVTVEQDGGSGAAPKGPIVLSAKLA